MLKFIGSGSAFNTRLGNNAAYIKEDGKLFLIDCGSSTFKSLKEQGVLEDVTEITVAVTHTHPDHIGSLGDLIFYSYYIMGEPLKPIIKIIYRNKMQLDFILNMMGVDKGLYEICETDNTPHYFVKELDLSVSMYKTKHVEGLLCYGYILARKSQVVYYSGDSNSIPEFILECLKAGQFDRFYQDTCKADYEGNVHLSLIKLSKIIPEDFRHLVYCMHLDEGFDREEAIQLGFGVVENE